MNITTTFPIITESIGKKTVSKEVIAQSAIPLEIRRNLSNQISTPRTRAQLKSSLILPR